MVSQEFEIKNGAGKVMIKSMSGLGWGMLKQVI